MASKMPFSDKTDIKALQKEKHYTASQLFEKFLTETGIAVDVD